MTESKTKLFGSAGPVEELRTMLRSRMSGEKIAELSHDDVIRHAQNAYHDEDIRRSNREAVLEDVEGGLLTEEKAQAMSDEDVRIYVQAKRATARLKEQAETPWSSMAEFMTPALRARRSSPTLARTPRDASAPAREVPDVHDPAFNLKLQAVLVDVVAVMAGQQAEIEELRAELARERNAKLAIFGQQAVIDQLTQADRNFEGFESIVELEEEASELTSGEKSVVSENASRVADVRDTRVGITILAQEVGALNAGRSVNDSEMSKAVERMKETAKRRTKIKSVGKVTIRAGKISR